MKISIVIPVYNDVRVARAIESVLSQTHDDYELIVVDGGSTDGTLEAIQPYRQGIATLISEPDCGIFDAINKGIRRATGDVIGLLGSDDRFSDTRVFQDIVAKLSASPADGCYGDMVFVDDADHETRYWKSGRFKTRNLYLGWMPPHFTLFLRRSVYERCGLFATDYRVAADYEFMLRVLLKHRISVDYIPRILLTMTAGGNSNGTLRNIIRGNRESFRAWRENRLNFGYLVPILKPAQKVAQFFMRAPSTAA
jgi:glycosyltransferase involved in cell wall biosynthesis